MSRARSRWVITSGRHRGVEYTRSLNTLPSKFARPAARSTGSEAPGSELRKMMTSYAPGGAFRRNVARLGKGKPYDSGVASRPRMPSPLVSRETRKLPNISRGPRTWRAWKRPARKTRGPTPHERYRRKIHEDISRAPHTRVDRYGVPLFVRPPYLGALSVLLWPEIFVRGI